MDAESDENSCSEHGEVCSLAMSAQDDTNDEHEFSRDSIKVKVERTSDGDNEDEDNDGDDGGGDGDNDDEGVDDDIGDRCVFQSEEEICLSSELKSELPGLHEDHSDDALVEDSKSTNKQHPPKKGSTQSLHDDMDITKRNKPANMSSLYSRYTAAQRLEMAEYAIKHGNSAACEYFTTLFDQPVKASTIQYYRQQYRLHGCSVFAQTLHDEAFINELMQKLKTIHESTVVIDKNIIKGVALGIIKEGGHSSNPNVIRSTIRITDHWLNSILHKFQSSIGLQSPQVGQSGIRAGEKHSLLVIPHATQKMKFSSDVQVEIAKFGIQHSTEAAAKHFTEKLGQDVPEETVFFLVDCYKFMSYFTPISEDITDMSTSNLKETFNKHVMDLILQSWKDGAQLNDGLVRSTAYMVMEEANAPSLNEKGLILIDEHWVQKCLRGCLTWAALNPRPKRPITDVSSSPEDEFGHQQKYIKHETGGRCSSKSHLGTQRESSTSTDVKQDRRKVCSKQNVKRGSYKKYTMEQQAEIAEYALQHGKTNAARHFSKKYGCKISESTIRGHVKKFEVCRSPLSKKGIEIKPLPKAKCGRPPILGDEMHEKLIHQLEELQSEGTIITKAMVVECGTRLVEETDRTLLVEHGGPLELTDTWAGSIYRIVVHGTSKPKKPSQ